jgi:sulfur-carrier protein adenylyltransferase/sulfurtransferase
VRGTIGIADADRVDLSNLHRQVLYRTSSVGDYKVTCAEKPLKEWGFLVLRLLIKIRLNPLHVKRNPTEVYILNRAIGTIMGT